jgi:hypothetical protein
MRAFGELIDGLDVEQFDDGIEIDLGDGPPRPPDLASPRPTRDRGPAGVGARLVVGSWPVRLSYTSRTGARYAATVLPESVGGNRRALRLPEATLRAYRLSRVRWVRELTDAQEEGESLDFA